jgi:hypothetical protein
MRSANESLRESGAAAERRKNRAHLPGTLAVNDVGAKTEKKSREQEQRADESSGTSAGSARRKRTIRQNIIGRGIAVRRGGFRGGRFVVRDLDGAFALFDQPAGEHGRGVFFEPLIEKSADLVAEIGGVAEARDFIRLQGIARSGEKKFPGSLGANLRHRCLQGGLLKRGSRDSNA